MPIRTCHYKKCEKAFKVTNGNQLYCPDKNCAILAKLERQQSQYEIGDDAKKAIQTNHKIFTELLGNNKKKEFELSNVIKKGFNSKGYFESYTNDGKMYYNVHNYIFEIDLTTNQNKINIWKH